jgi:hypothetical protein
MRTTNYDLPNAQYNRTYYAITIEMPEVLSLTTASITMSVKLKIDGKVLKEYKSVGYSTTPDKTIGKISIDTSLPRHFFTIDEHRCTLQPGEYMYDILIDFGSDPENRKSYIAGNWIVEETVTYKA